MQNLYSFFDESGKFADHAVVAFGGLIGDRQQIHDFDLAWGAALLREYGMPHLTMKKALRADLPLGENKPAIGIETRTEALTQFLDCAKNHAELIVGCAIDVRAFQKVSGPARIHLGKNPQYAAFARVTMELVSYIEAHQDDGHLLSMICDDEQAAAIPMYKLYVKTKNYYPSIRKMFSSFTMGDEEIYVGLQGADMISSIIRYEARCKFLGEEYNYAPLHARLITAIDRPERQADVRIGFFDAATFSKVSAGFDDFAIQHPAHSAEPLVEER